MAELQGKTGKKVRAKLITSEISGPEENSHNVYELDLSVVNQVMADGEALMNLALISKGQSSYNTITCQLD